MQSLKTGPDVSEGGSYHALPELITAKKMRDPYYNPESASLDSSSPIWFVDFLILSLF